MEKLKLYFNDGASLVIPENIGVKYIVNSAITNLAHNISISVLHKVDNITLVLRDIYVTSIKDKIVVKVERYNDNFLIDTLIGDELSTSWNLGSDVVAKETMYNEVINIGDR